MAIVNLSRFFNVEYFEGYGEEDKGAFECIHLEKNNKDRKKYENERNKRLHKEILRCRAPQYKPAKVSDNEQNFLLQVEYPGLMTGVGYPHAAGTEGEICAGCSLDYVTGLPYIPGSSVKGILRYAFRQEEYIKEILGNENIDIKALEKEIFEGNDIFLDAYPVDGVENGIFALENITPHHNTELGTLAEPQPLTFVKVRPGVVYSFRFVLNDCDALNAEAKLELFKQIILDFGVGAKTNVGFGRFTADIKPVVSARTERPVESQPANQSIGRCKVCNVPTGKNSYTGKYYEYCFKHKEQGKFK